MTTLVRRRITHVVATSGGTGSWMTGMVVAHQIAHPRDRIIQLFSDTRTEDPDLYRFLRESSPHVGGELVTLDQGQDIWGVFREKRFLGNSRIDPCSLALKRRPQRAWIDEHCDPATTVVYLGIDWTEDHRFRKAKSYWAPWKVRAPLIEPGWMYTKEMIASALADLGIELPALTREGFPHNNCGGGCVKAGKGHWLMVLDKRPETFAVWEKNEQEMRDFLGANVSMLTDRRGGTRRPYTLRELRQEAEVDRSQIDLYDIGGCGCATGDLDEDARVIAATEEPR